MLQEDLVTLITPLYNGENFIERFLKSVLAQTYDNVQFILVNDGSTDNSDQIVEKYENQLKEKLKEFIYLKQENSGAASAVNNALKYVDGEFLCWADCDDELMPENIYKKWSYLKKNKEYGMVNCAATAMDQETGEILNEMSIPKSKRKKNMFLEIIDGIPVYSGVFMIRTQLLFDKIKNREIYYNSEAGQNYQLLLPVAYNNQCGFIDDRLYNCYVRSDSHSHNVNYEKIYERTYVREILLDNVLKFMPFLEKNVLMEKIRLESAFERFNLSFNANDRVRNNESFDEFHKKCKVSLKVKIKHIVINVRLFNKIYRAIRRRQ